MREKTLYILADDLYRMGNSSSSRLANVRRSDINTREIGETDFSVADNNGVSVFTKEGLDECPLTGWVWELKAGTILPAGLTIVKRGSKGHHMIVPAENMPLAKYISLLESVAMFCEKQYMKRA